MPFITKDRREMIENETLVDWQPGDLCYYYYKKMVEKWKANPRWTTAHKIYADMISSLNYSHFPLNMDGNLKFALIKGEAAVQLAWQVFFIKYVVPYENQKEIENGDI